MTGAFSLLSLRLLVKFSQTMRLTDAGRPSSAEQAPPPGPRSREGAEPSTQGEICAWVRDRSHSLSYMCSHSLPGPQGLWENLRKRHSLSRVWFWDGNSQQAQEKTSEPRKGPCGVGVWHILEAAFQHGGKGTGYSTNSI